MKSTCRYQRARGATLSELCVVIAVIAIVSVSVVSFTALASAITKTSAKKEVVAERIDLVENLVEDWIENAITKNATELKAQTNKLVATIDDKQQILSFSNNKVIASFLEDNEVNLAANEIIQIEFEEMRNDSDVIFFCTITYVYENFRKEEIKSTYTFCVNTRLDDVV